MKRFNRSILAMALVGGVFGGVGCAQPGPVVVSADAERHPHMHHALAQLHEARHELEQADPIFKGHRDEAVEHVDRAIQQVAEGLSAQGDNAGFAALPPARDFEGVRFRHMHLALERLKRARADLESADPIFAGHRDKAIEATDRAVKQVEEGIHGAER